MQGNPEYGVMKSTTKIKVIPNGYHKMPDGTLMKTSAMKKGNKLHGKKK